MTSEAQKEQAVDKIQQLREMMSKAKEVGSDISVAESHFSRLRYFFEKKDFTKVDGIVEQIESTLKRASDESQKFDIYTQVLTQALDDGIITADENRMLRAIRRRMNISEEKHTELVKKLERPSSFTLSAYESAVEQAMMNGVVSEDEQAILDRFRGVANISMKAHMEVEEKIRKRSLLLLTNTKKKKSLFDEDNDEIKAQEAAAKVGDDTILEEPVEGEMDIGDASYWVEQGKLLWYASDDLSRDFSDIVERFQNAIELDPENPMGWASLGSFLKKMGRLENSLECFEMAMKIDPEFINPIYNKAMVLSSLGQIQEALDTLDLVLAKDPANKQALSKKVLLQKALQG